MAGSYKHCCNDDGSFRFDLIENMGDAHETCEEMHGMIRRLQRWVDDLQSGMYINCVYCGHRYGPSPETPVAMSEVLKQHIATCPKHPLFEANVAIVALKKQLADAGQRCRASKSELVAVLEVILMQLDGPPTEMIGAVFDGRELEKARTLLAKEKRK